MRVIVWKFRTIFPGKLQNEKSEKIGAKKENSNVEITIFQLSSFLEEKNRKNSSFFLFSINLNFSSTQPLTAKGGKVFSHPSSPPKKCHSILPQKIFFMFEKNDGKIHNKQICFSSEISRKINPSNPHHIESFVFLDTIKNKKYFRYLIS